MKKTTLVAMGVTACIAFGVTSSPAQDKSEKKAAAPAQGGSGHSHSTKIPATVEEIWQAIHKQRGNLADVVAKKELDEAHDHAFAIRDLVKALPGKVAADFKANAEESAKEIARIAAEIDKSGAAGAQKATEAGVKKMEAAITALEGKLKSKGSTKSTS